MPIYEYECSKCGVFERSQSISEDALKRCPTCRCKVEKLISRSAFHLKGGGWYNDGYDTASNKGEASGSSDSGSSSGTTATTKATTKKAKPAAKPKSSGKKAARKKAASA